MYYAITFTRDDGATMNTWSNWHLVPSSRPVVAPPKPKYVEIDIPGSDGTIDLSTVLTGDIVYENRTGSWEFVVMNEKPETWYDLYSSIMGFLHGSKVKIFLEEEPEYYFEGRCDIDEWASDPDYSRITINYNVYPYKLHTTEEYINYISNGQSRNFTIVTERMPVIPRFVVQSAQDVTPNVVVTYKAVEYNLNSRGTVVIPGIVFTEGNNTITFNGTVGIVNMYYRKGKL